MTVSGARYSAYLEVDGIDYTKFLSRVRCVVNATLMLPTFTITLTTDPTQIFTRDIRKAQIYLRLVSKTETEQVLVKWRLLPVADNKYAPERGIDDDRFTPTVYTFNATDAEAFKIAATLVNRFKINCFVHEILSDIITDASATPEILTETNNQLYKQILIPPMSLNQAIKYLQKQFGIASGGLLKHINYKQQVVVADMGKLVKTYSKPILIYMRRYDQDFVTAEEQGGNQINRNRYAFRTDPIIQNVQNKQALKNKFKQTVIAKPLNSLYKVTEYSLKDIAEQKGVTDAFFDVTYSQVIESTENVCHDESIYHHDDNPIEIEGTIAAITNQNVVIVGILEQFFDFRHFLYDPDTFGFVAIVKSYSDSTQSISGRYLLAASDILLTKEQEEHWSYQIKVKLQRTYTL